MNVKYMKQMKREGKLSHGGGSGGGLIGPSIASIKIMSWLTEPIFIDLFSIYIFRVSNMNRIMKDPIMKLISFT